MPNLLPAFVIMTMVWGGLPVLISAILGSRLGRNPFAWKQLGWMVVGSIAGIVMLPGASILFAILLSGTASGPIGFVFTIVMGVVCSVATARGIARLGRPIANIPSIHELDQTCQAIEDWMGEWLIRVGNESPSSSDAQGSIHGLPPGDAEEWDEIRKARARMHAAPNVLHEEIAIWVHRATQLLDRLNTSGRQPESTLLAEDGNPYRPTTA